MMQTFATVDTYKVNRLKRIPAAVMQLDSRKLFQRGNDFHKRFFVGQNGYEQLFL